MSMFPIATITASGSTSSVTFSSIPQTFTHLQLRVFARESSGTQTVGDYAAIQFNNDGTANYTWHQLGGDGGGAFSSGSTGYGALPTVSIAGNNATSGVYGGGIIDILDYTNTNKYKTIRSLGGVDNNGSGYAILKSGVYLSNTNAITIINVATGGGQTFSSNSTFQLYGITTA